MCFTGNACLQQLLQCSKSCNANCTGWATLRLLTRPVQGRALMAPYLPRDGASSSPYSEGGALYALGLIHANNGTGIR